MENEIDWQKDALFIIDINIETFRQREGQIDILINEEKKMFRWMLKYIDRRIDKYKNGSIF